MNEFVRDTTDPAPDPDAHGVDLVDGDEPSIRLLIRGDVPDALDHDGRTWRITSETHQEGDEPPITVFRPSR